MKTFSLYSLALLLLVVTAAGCSDTNGQNADDAPDAETPVAAAGTGERSVRVETLVLAPAAFEDVIELTGEVEALNDATLSAQSAGTVVSLVPLGRSVAAGQVVAQLDPSLARAAMQQAQASVEAAQASLDLAEDNYNRQAPLYRDSVISALEFESVRAQRAQARAQVGQARAQLAQAQQQLNNTRVVTPFAGTVETRFVEPGEQVMPGVPVARVVSTGNVKVTAGVPERYAADIRVGSPVRVAFKSYGGAASTGRVSFVGNAIDAQSRTFPIEVVLTGAGALKPQMVANLYVTRAELEEVIVVPRAAVLRDEMGTSVFVVVNEGGRTVAQRRDVQVGDAYGGQVVVTGVQAGEEVIIQGQNSLTRGDLVEVVSQHTSAAQSGLAPETTPLVEAP